MIVCGHATYCTSDRGKGRSPLVQSTFRAVPANGSCLVLSSSLPAPRQELDAIDQWDHCPPVGGGATGNCADRAL